MARSISLVPAVLVVIASPAFAQTALEGVVHHDPLRVVTDDTTFRNIDIAPGLRAVLNQAELEDQEVAVQVTGRRISAVEGTARGNIALLTRPGLGSNVVTTLKAHTGVLITGSRRSGDRLWLRVRRNDDLSVQGVVSVDQLELVRPGAIGSWLGRQLAPLFAAGTTKREARFFHPDGHVFQAEVTSLEPEEAPFRKVADAVAGQAIIRIGGGARRLNADGTAKDAADVLSLAIRFTGADHALDTKVRPGDQDLLLSAWAERFRHFAVRSWLGDSHDFMNNIYFPAIPYQIEGKPVWLRVIPKRDKLPGLSVRWSSSEERIKKLEKDIAADRARFILQVQRGEWWRVYRPWTSLAEIRFTKQRPDIDQTALKYHPDLQGAGLKPVGFVTDVRTSVYRASQDARDRLGATQRLERTGK